MSKCGVCKTVVSKYKCPVCSTKYCSVGCYKSHKSSPNCATPTTQENVENQPPAYQFETDDTVNPERLEHLRQDSKVREALENRHLRNMLKHLNSSENPYEAMEKAMQEPLFHELTLKCLNAISRDPE